MPRFRSLIGDEGALAVQAIIEHAHHQQAGVMASVIGIVVLFIGATGVFAELQDSLNAIWKVRTKPGRTVRAILRTRLLSFTMVFAIGFLLLVSLLLSAALSALGSWLYGETSTSSTLLHVGDFIMSFVILGGLFAGSFKLLPDVSVRWRDVWFGACVASALFAGGKYLIGLYLGKSAVASAFGSMGALAVLLIWIYFSSQIFLIGALFTHARALINRAPLAPTRNAEWIPGHEPAEEMRAVMSRGNQ